MRFILVVVVVNLLNIADPSIMAHKVFNNKEQCEAAIELLPTPPKNLRASSFCVAEDDLIEVKSHT